MKEFSVPMAIIDFIPVLLFAIAAIMLQRDLYNKMSKGAFSLFAAGTIDIIFAGTLKFVYKLLYALGICDFKALNTLFFPVQSIGFLLAGLGVLAMICHNQKESTLLSAAPPAFSGTLFFVTLMIVGLSIMYAVLGVLSIKLKKPALIVLFALSFICSLGMGYLSSRNCNSSFINWIAEITNIIGQGLLLISVLELRKAGLGGLKI